MSSRIVGIGASAGGLESLERLFSAMPADTGMSFVVIQHLSPDFRSLMDELIARHSEMPVTVAEDGTVVEPNHIYLLPPRKEMIIRGRQLILTDKPNGLSLPIDLFFRSLAQDVGSDAVGVVLSGSGSDGSRGVVDIKRAGGTVMIESPATAKFDGMPLSAQGTGVVDHSASPRDLSRLLCGLPPLDPIDNETDDTLSEDPAMDALLRLIREHFGLDFSLYKMTTVGRRVQRRADMLRAVSLESYVELVRADQNELNALYQDLLIGVTQFFRDPEAFDLLEREVIPALLDKTPPEQEIRVWCAGCATGEEAYSLAMMFVEQMTARGRPVLLKILATDVHPLSLEIASQGIYGEPGLANVSPARRERFFIKRSTGFQVSPELRQLIVFARHNVTKDAPFTKLSFISCRNMLIYLQPQAQRTVLSLFHFALSSSGVMFLGASESPGPLSDEFIAIDEHWKIFKKRRDVALLANVKLPPLGAPVRTRSMGFETSARTHGPDPLILATYDQLLDKFMPPSLLVDEDRALIDSFGGAERMLRVRKRRPTTNVLDMLDGELRNIVAGAIQRASKDGAKVAFAGVRIFDEESDKRCNVTAEPFIHPRTGARNVLVTFQDMVPAEPIDTTLQLTATHIPMDQVSRDRMETLETELAYTRETLQATIEELETSNEEMQATNEELVASNEELQSTNEELHSVNEELYTVNAEYQQKIIELKELNADMQHLLEGTDVGTVFLDRELRIRRYTSRIASVFRIQGDDIGRKIIDFSHNIVRPTLMEEIERVRTNGQTIEDEVRDREGTPYLLRILPYRVNRTRESKVSEPLPIDGVVLTLTDVSTLAKARARLAELSAIVESSEDAIIAKTLDGTVVHWNRGAERLYGYRADEMVGNNIRIVEAPECAGATDRMIAKLRSGEKVEQAHVVHVRKDGKRIDVSKTLSMICDASGRPTGVSSIGRDITALMTAQRNAEEGQQKIKALLDSTAEAALRREQFLAMLSHELRNPLAAVLGATAVMQSKTSIDGTLLERCRAVIERQSRHMARLLDDLLDVSRITRGKFELRSAPLDLRAALEAAIESTLPFFKQKAVTLETSLPDEPLPMTGDLARLQQIVVNLLSNAANYSQRGGRVDLRVVTHGDQVTLRVVDHGFGIERDMLDKIFELFVQAEQRIDRPRGGLGVGLSLAKSIVELHGGSIEARSDGPNMGSEFVVRLPLARGHEKAASKRETRGPRRRIVLVEDQQDAREMMRMLLESLDHEVLDAPDGATGVELIEKVKPDFALIDIGLPTMTGYEVAQRIRSKKDLKRIMLIALTGYGTAGDVSAAHSAGFDAHLVKPADFSKLQALLAAHKDDDALD